jgi:hypothetical protein
MRARSPPTTPLLRRPSATVRLSASGEMTVSRISEPFAHATGVEVARRILRAAGEQALKEAKTDRPQWA